MVRLWKNFILYLKIFVVVIFRITFSVKSWFIFNNYEKEKGKVWKFKPVFYSVKGRAALSQYLP